MNPRVKNVVPNNDYTLKLTFDNGEEKIFDVKPYMDKGIFKELNEMHLFSGKTVRISARIPCISKAAVSVKYCNIEKQLSRQMEPRGNYQKGRADKQPHR